jgi:hypothetical protein
MIKTTRTIVMIFTAVVLTTSVTSCLKDNRRTVECDPFSNQSDLAWFAGLDGETLTFQNQDGAEKIFVIEDKYIIHTTSFLTESGCNCHDIWGILLSSDADSVGIFSQYIYNENQEARLDNLNMRIDGAFTGFSYDHKTLLTSFEVEGVVFNDVIRFQFNYTDDLQFHTVYLAKELGIVQLNRVNGEVWVNTQLDRKLRIDFDSFRYSESECP